MILDSTRFLRLVDEHNEFPVACQTPKFYRLSQVWRRIPRIFPDHVLYRKLRNVVLRLYLPRSKMGVARPGFRLQPRLSQIQVLRKSDLAKADPKECKYSQCHQRDEHHRWVSDYMGGLHPNVSLVQYCFPYPSLHSPHLTSPSALVSAS